MQSRLLYTGVVTALTALLAPVRGQVPLVIDENTTIDTYVEERVQIVPGTKPPTVVTVLEGGYLSGLELYGSSILDISGGHGHGTAYDSSVINVLSGEMEVQTQGSSRVNFLGGYAEVSEADGSSTWQVRGGSIDFLHALGSSAVYVSAGIHEMLIGHDTSRIHLSGGSVNMLRAGDPAGTSFPGPDSNVIYIAGGPFSYPYGRIPDPSGRLQGVLANGDPINALFETYEQASIVLVPEPSSLLLLGLGAATLLWLHRRGPSRHPGKTN